MKLGMNVLTSGMHVAKSVAPFDLSYFKEKDGHPLDAFAKTQEILNTVNQLNQKGDAAGYMLHQPAATNFILEILESSPETTGTGMPHQHAYDQSASKKPQEAKICSIGNNAKGLSQSIIHQTGLCSIPHQHTRQVIPDISSECREIQQLHQLKV